MREISVHDGAIPATMMERLRFALARLPYQYGWRSNLKHDWPGHWNAQIVTADHKNTQDQAPAVALFEPPWDIFNDYWRYVAGTFFTEPALLRFYSNTYTYGTDGYPHTDSDRAGEYTALLYVNPEWKPEWAGATAIWRAAGREIEQAVLPAPGRLVIFPCTRLHAAWAVSRVCPVARTVLVMKVSEP